MRVNQYEYQQAHVLSEKPGKTNANWTFRTHDLPVNSNVRLLSRLLGQKTATKTNVCCWKNCRDAVVCALIVRFVQDNFVDWFGVYNIAVLVLFKNKLSGM